MVTPSDTLRDALRAWIATRTAAGNHQAPWIDSMIGEWRTLLAAFAEWEKAPAPASSRLREAAAACATEDCFSWGIGAGAPILKRLRDALAAEPEAPQPPVASGRLWAAASSAVKGFTTYVSQVGHQDKKSWGSLLLDMDLLRNAVNDEPKGALAAEPEAPTPVAAKGGYDFTESSGKAVGWSSPQRTAELQARIDELKLETRALGAIGADETKRAEIAEARVKELEGELREAAGKQIAGDWADLPRLLANDKINSRLYSFFEEDGTERRIADVESAWTKHGCEQTRFHLAKLDADAVAKLAKAVKQP